MYRASLWQLQSRTRTHTSSGRVISHAIKDLRRPSVCSLRLVSCCHAGVDVGGFCSEWRDALNQLDDHKIDFLPHSHCPLINHYWKSVHSQFDVWNVYLPHLHHLSPMSLIGVYIVNLIEKLPIHFSSTIYLYIISSKQYFTNLKSEKMQAHLPKLSISQRPNETKVRPNGNKDKPQGHTPRHGIFFNLLPLTILWNGGKNWNIWLCHQHLSLPAHKPQCKVMPRKDLLHKRYGRLRGDFH